MTVPPVAVLRALLEDRSAVRGLLLAAVLGASRDGGLGDDGCGEVGGRGVLRLLLLVVVGGLRVEGRLLLLVVRVLLLLRLSVGVVADSRREGRDEEERENEFSFSFRVFRNE